VAKDADDVHDPLLGRVIDGRFTIRSVLGRGGMGVVYCAHQASLERSVALKVMTGVAPERELEFQRRFFLEAATVAKLKHPNTITVFDYGSGALDDERIFFIAMELLEGQTLSQLLTKGRALVPLRALNIALQICRSLREAHKAGVVHRDLKPNNIMLVKQDEGDDVEGDFVKVLDFGLAKSTLEGEGITKAGTFMGSPRYVAPEQIEGRAVDQRTDVYSLGCLMFRMLAGRVPFDGAQAFETMRKHLREPPPRLDVPGLPFSFIHLVDDCLKKNAAERPPSMDAVVHRLKLVRAELGGTSSGITMLSDEKGTLPGRDAVFESSMPSTPSTPSMPPAPDPSIPRRPLPRPSIPPRIVRPQAPQSRAQDLFDEDPSGEDSTRPTRVLALHLKGAQRRPWRPIVAGVGVGLALCSAFIAHRLDHLMPLLARIQADGDASPVEPPAVMTAGTSARAARVRIKTTPAGADVLEVQEGLPRLLGITPLTLQWDVEHAPHTRELVLRKDGYAAAKAILRPPAPGRSEPVWLDVQAVLRQDASVSGSPGSASTSP
jgi:serine/threonine-protein kinase